MAVQLQEVKKTMRAWVLTEPGKVEMVEKPIPEPGFAEVLVKIEAVAICGTDLEILHNGLPALIEEELPFQKGHVIGHEYVGTVVKLGPSVDEFQIGDRVVVEIHNGCGRCERCRHGMYTSCLNYSRKDKQHRANGFTTDGGFSEYAVNHINTLFKLPDHISWEEGTLVVTAGTAMYGLDVLGGLIAGETILVSGPGPIGLMGVACAKALGATVILMGTRENRLELGRRLGADYTINVREENVMEKVMEYSNGGVDLVLECSGAPNAVNESLYMTKRGGKICLAAFSRKTVEFDAAYMVRNNIYMYGIRGEGNGAVKRGLALVAQGKVDCKPFITHRFTLEELPEALRVVENRIGDPIKAIVTP